MSQILPPDFYLPSTLYVARHLLGAKLVRMVEGQRMTGRIVETEAYTGLDDMASHGRVKRTPRNLPMWEAPARAYVYLTHGIHWMLCPVTEPEGHPAAVLIRALEPLEGLEMMRLNRGGKPLHLLTSGPGRLTQALAITGAENRADLTNPDSGIWIEADQSVSDDAIDTGARIGLGKRVPEPWFSIPWRWWIRDNPHVSR